VSLKDLEIAICSIYGLRGASLQYYRASNKTYLPVGTDQQLQEAFQEFLQGKISIVKFSVKAEDVAQHSQLPQQPPQQHQYQQQPPTQQPQYVNSTNEVHHCQHCGLVIQNTRFSCIVCQNYHLCEPCETFVTQYHPIDHPFFKHRVPPPPSFEQIQSLYSGLYGMYRCTQEIDSILKQAQVKEQVQANLNFIKNEVSTQFTSLSDSLRSTANSLREEFLKNLKEQELARQKKQQDESSASSSSSSQ